MLIGNRIRKRRLQIGMSQQMLAKKLNISPKAIRNWEADISSPSLDNLMLLAKTFNCTLDSLVGNDEHVSIKIDGLRDADAAKIVAIVQVFVDMTLEQYHENDEK